MRKFGIGSVLKLSLTDLIRLMKRTLTLLRHGTLGPELRGIVPTWRSNHSIFRSLEAKKEPGVAYHRALKEDRAKMF